MWGGQYASYHHNLIAHHHSRAIRFNGARAHDTTAIVDYRNNVICNWGNSNAAYGNEIEVNGGTGQLNLVNNYYKGGPATPASRASVIFDITEAYNAATPNKPVATVYAAGNYSNGYPAVTADNWTGIRLHNYPNTAANVALFKQLAPTPALAPVTTQTALVAYDLVLAGAGAIVPLRDPLDTRIVNETRAGTATGGSPAGSTAYGVGQDIIDTQTEVGGWPAYAPGTAPADTDHDGMPDAWETSHGLDPTLATDRNGLGSSGYTNLEEYLNSLALTTVLAAKTGTAILALQAYPNPAHDRLTVAHPAASAGATLAVYSYLGQRVASLPVAVGATTTLLPLQQLPAGNYLVFYADSQQQYTTRFAKE